MDMRAMPRLVRHTASRFAPNCPIPPLRLSSASHAAIASVYLAMAPAVSPVLRAVLPCVLRSSAVGPADSFECSGLTLDCAHDDKLRPQAQ